MNDVVTDWSYALAGFLVSMLFGVLQMFFYPDNYTCIWLLLEDLEAGPPVVLTGLICVWVCAMCVGVGEEGDKQTGRQNKVSGRDCVKQVAALACVMSLSIDSLAAYQRFVLIT